MTFGTTSATKHTHRVVCISTRPFTGCVADRRDSCAPAAHGGIVDVHICDCGATRRIARNGHSDERGRWMPGTATYDVRRPGCTAWSTGHSTRAAAEMEMRVAYRVTGLLHRIVPRI